MSSRSTKNGVPFAVAELDAVERRFWRDIWDATPRQVADEHGVQARAFGPVQATIVAALPEARMLNLVLGATEPNAVDGGHLGEALEWVESHDACSYVPVAEGEPEAAAAVRLLRARGYEPGFGWMKFVRGSHPPRFPEPAGVEVAELHGEEEPFAMIAATGFGLPAWASAFFADLPGRPGWRCYVASVEGSTCACAAMLVQGQIAEFGIAATLEPARGRGCQLALLRRRIVDALAAGCQTLFVETGERAPGRATNSYRNILRAGFEEAYLRPNWQKAPTGIEPV